MKRLLGHSVEMEQKVYISRKCEKSPILQNIIDQLMYFGYTNFCRKTKALRVLAVPFLLRKPWGRGGFLTPLYTIYATIVV